MWKDAKLLLFFLAALGPRGFVRAFSSCGELVPPLPCRALGLFLRGGLLRCGCGAEALEGGLSCDGEAKLHQPLPACMWNLCESGIQSCSLHWQGDSHPLRPQGSPKASFLMAGLLCIHM